MKNTKILLILAALALCLCACGPDNPTADTEPDDSISMSSSQDPQPTRPLPETEPSGSITEDDTLPPHEGMARSRLTNEWVDASVAATRPIAVIIPNEANAVPHYNLSQASVLYEANVEGSMTRFMALYDDWKDLEKIGNVRSLRTYYMYWAFEWDACIVHSGGPFFIDELIAQPDTQTINDHLGTDAAAFFEDETRSKPHRLYANGPGLLEVFNSKDYPLEYRGLADRSHFQFVGKANPNTLEQYGKSAQNATYIDMSGCYPLTRCYFEYNEEDGLYYRSQYLSRGTDGPHIDAVTGEQLSFRNILVQNVLQEDLGEGYLALQCQDTTQDGWFFTCGKGIHVTWEKTSDYGATRYYDDNGDEIVLNTGKTMICVVETGDNFTFR
ncbi:MAG: DUF3048 domain-containing protein [Acetatifactor sp.]|nr:DUF3048 domain-containing protein [Acetatifactor sp.]MDE7352640.1 DUF3048 domain-containing protein [Acetatifactor sp.]